MIFLYSLIWRATSFLFVIAFVLIFFALLAYLSVFIVY